MNFFLIIPYQEYSPAIFTIRQPFQRKPRKDYFTISRFPSFVQTAKMPLIVLFGRYEYYDAYNFAATRKPIICQFCKNPIHKSCIVIGL